MEVPFLDLQAQYKTIKKDVDEAIQQVLDTSAYVMGPAVFDFEKAFAEYLGVKHALAISSGTDALHIALRALGVGSGDEVILPANTFFATAEAVSLVGATPVLADVVEKTYTIDPEKIEGAITAKTKCIIPVHLYGQSADLDPILAIAEKHGISVLEDAAQAHGATYNDTKVGGFGTAACFSFYPGKNLGTYGEGGAITTNDDKLAATARLIRDHGSSKKYYHEIIGGNFRMSGIEGAVLGVKLPHLDKWNGARRAHAARYDEFLADVPGMILPVEPAYSKGVYHLYVVRVKDRDAFQTHLKEKGIHTGIHYPVPIHLQEAYKELSYADGDFPVTEKVSKEIVSLPMYAELTNEQIECVASVIRDYKA